MKKSLGVISENTSFLMACFKRPLAFGDHDVSFTSGHSCLTWLAHRSVMSFTLVDSFFFFVFCFAVSSACIKTSVSELEALSEFVEVSLLFSL